MAEIQKETADFRKRLLDQTKSAAYVGKSVMTLWRWRRNPRLKFPPAIVINDREYFTPEILDGWLEQMPTKKPTKAA